MKPRERENVKKKDVKRFRLQREREREVLFVCERSTRRQFLPEMEWESGRRERGAGEKYLKKQKKQDLYSSASPMINERGG